MHVWLILILLSLTEAYCFQTCHVFVFLLTIFSALATNYTYNIGSFWTTIYGFNNRIMSLNWFILYFFVILYTFSDNFGKYGSVWFFVIPYGKHHETFLLLPLHLCTFDVFKLLPIAKSISLVTLTLETCCKLSLLAVFLQAISISAWALSLHTTILTSWFAFGANCS